MINDEFNIPRDIAENSKGARVRSRPFDAISKKVAIKKNTAAAVTEQV